MRGGEVVRDDLLDTSMAKGVDLFLWLFNLKKNPWLQ